jgi:hypothetical protein
MECSASEQPASPAEAVAAKRWRLAMPFAFGLIVGGGIGTSALFLPGADLPGEALAAVWQEARPAGAFDAAAPAFAATRSDEPAEASPGLAGRRGDGQPRPAGLLALGEPVERLPAAAPAPAMEPRRVWWNMPALGAPPLAVGSAR